MQRFVPFLCMGLLACTSDTWHKPGASEDDYLNDYHDCEREAEAEHEDGLVNRLFRSRYIDECMRNKGWTDTS